MRRSAWQRTITDSGGVPVSGVQITVFQSNGVTPATIFSTAGGAAQANPFVTPTAVAKFFALPGVYVVQAFKDGQTQTFSDVEIGAKNYRDDQGALGGTAIDVANLTTDTTVMSEGGAFRFLSSATGKPTFADSGLVFAAPSNATPTSLMLGVGSRANSTRVGFMGVRAAPGTAPAWVELWDKALNPPQAFAADIGGGVGGPLLTVGSFGLGTPTTPPTLAQVGATMDTGTLPSGLWRIVTSDTGNKPASFGDFSMLNMRHNNVDQQRLAIGLTGEVWSYASTSGVWNATGWRRQYDSLNAQGSVTHDGTKNTGAIMEYGSNANGVYYKYLDGRLECYQTRSAAMAANTEDAFTWTFPAVFASAPSYIGTVIGGGSVTNNFGITKSAYTTQSTTGATMRNQVTVAQTHVQTFCAVGRWR